MCITRLAERILASEGALFFSYSCSFLRGNKKAGQRGYSSIRPVLQHPFNELFIK
jgi:hypothetical protein